MSVVYLDEKNNRFSAVEQPVIVREREIHHLAPCQSNVVEIARRIHTGRTSTLPSIATGFSFMACKPRTAKSLSVNQATEGRDAPYQSVVS